MVSHRLEMITDYDMIVMMDHGVVVEVGAPKVRISFGHTQ